MGELRDALNSADAGADLEYCACSQSKKHRCILDLWAHGNATPDVRLRAAQSAEATSGVGERRPKHLPRTDRAFLFLDTYLTVLQCDGIKTVSMNCAYSGAKKGGSRLQPVGL
jgi:hypothetical protein